MGRKIGLIYIIPIALSKLEVNALAEGSLYKGDLLKMVSELLQEFWRNNPELNNRLVEIIGELKIMAETINCDLMPKLETLNYV